MQNLIRQTEIKTFLDNKAKLDNYRIEKMSTDASSRKYYRVFLTDGTTKILVDDEGCKNHSAEFIYLAKFFAKYGVKAPKVYSYCLRKGFMLIEDLGNTDFEKIADGKNNMDLLKKAVDILVKLHKIEKRPECVGDMDEKVISANFALFIDWYVPACLNKQLSDEARAEFFAIVKKIMPVVRKLPKNIVLWDYHANNVMFPTNSSDAAVIDFQDSMYGCGLYDLASLIEDERHALTEAQTAELKEYYFKQMPELQRQDFEKAYAYMALLRHMRVLGRFTTLITVSKRPHYAQYVPHGIELLKQSLKNSLFAEIKVWIDKYFPESKWGIPTDKKITKAFVLAAGRGSRMRELTRNTPKPMLKIGDKPLIAHGLDLVRGANIKDVVVNVSYQKEKLQKYLAKIKDLEITVSEEQELLETGGGIKKMLKHFDNQALVVINSDNILIDDGYKPILYQMFDVWNDDKYDMLLLLQKMDEIKVKPNNIGSYKIEGDKIVRNKDKIAGNGFDYGYVGVAIMHPRIFEGETENKFSLLKLFDKAESEGRLGYAISNRNEFWVDSPEALQETVDFLHINKINN